MKKLKIIAAPVMAALGLMTFLTAAPAQAHDWDHDEHRGRPHYMHYAYAPQIIYAAPQPRFRPVVSYYFSFDRGWVKQVRYVPYYAEHPREMCRE